MVMSIYRILDAIHGYGALVAPFCPAAFWFMFLMI